jgi:hypothetical protein
MAEELVSAVYEVNLQRVVSGFLVNQIAARKDNSKPTPHLFIA